MTRDETIKVLATLKAAYPSAYKGMTKDEANGTIATWAAQFAGTPALVVHMAIQKLIGTNVFPPSISEVKSKLRGMYWEAWMKIKEHEQCPDLYGELDPKELQAYRIVLQACERYHRDASAQELSLGELLDNYAAFLPAGSDDQNLLE